VILVDLDGVAMSRPGKALFGDLSLTLSSGDRLGIVGLNGCGKSTLLRVLTGAAEPESGNVRRGRGVRVAALDQVPVLPSGLVLEAVGDGWEAAAVLDRLGMGGLTDAEVDTLSGGQAKRVALARTLVTESDLLVLDEPTNHLDMATKEMLITALSQFEGTMLFVSHDRHFLAALSNRVLELTPEGIHQYGGGYTEYVARTGDEAPGLRS